MKNILTFSILLLLCSSLTGQNSFVDERDGNVYRTITFNGLSWMKENLRYRSVSGAKFFDNDTNNVQLYGALYDWETATKVCPSGWHLPSGTEYRVLSDFFENKDLWLKGPSDPDAFNIQLGGHQDYEGIFSEMDESAYYWTSTEYDEKNAEYFSYLLIMDMPVIDISRKTDISDIHGAEKTNKYSVRCVKD